MIACTSTASASRRKSTFPSTPRLRSSPRTSMLSLTTSSPPRASTVFAREDDAVVSLSLDLCYTTSWDSTRGAYLRLSNRLLGRGVCVGGPIVHGGAVLIVGPHGDLLVRGKGDLVNIKPDGWDHLNVDCCGPCCG